MLNKKIISKRISLNVAKKNLNLKNKINPYFLAYHVFAEIDKYNEIDDNTFNQIMKESFEFIEVNNRYFKIAAERIIHKLNPDLYKK